MKKQEARSKEQERAAKTFEDLLVWQKAHVFVLAVYKYSEAFSKNEMYGLSSQLRRAAVSIAANIAEGFAKQGTADKLRFYNIAQGSLEECKYYLILSRDLGFGENSHLSEKLYEVGRLLGAYTKAIKEVRSKE